MVVSATAKHNSKGGRKIPFNNIMTENFIRTYSDALPEQLLNTLLQMIDQQVMYSPKANTRSDKFRRDKQIAIDPFWPGITEDINQALVQKLAEYMDDFPYLQDQGRDWWSGTCILQKTEPMEGYHAFHAENAAWLNRQRVLAWMVYLNDVEEGGETEFLYQKLRIKPTKNTLLIWPGSFTHLHRGNPPMSTKYVLTGWFSPMQGMSKFKVTEPN